MVGAHASVLRRNLALRLARVYLHPRAVRTLGQDLYDLSHPSRGANLEPDDVDGPCDRHVDVLGERRVKVSLPVVDEELRAEGDRRIGVAQIPVDQPLLERAPHASG